MDKIEQILQELFEFEPELKAHEPQVRSAISAMLASKPEIKIDPAFAKKLKAQLLSLEPARPGAFSSQGLKAFFAHLRQPAFAYGLAGLLVVVLATGSFYAGQKKAEVKLS